MQQLKEIADAVEEDDMLLAQYEAENLIAIYGTHVTNKALAGASITMLSFTKVDDSHTSVSIKANLSASFKANFLGIVKGEAHLKAHFGLDFDSTTHDESSQSYIITKGGADVNRLLDKNDDGNKLHVDSVVGIKFNSVPLYTLVHENSVKSHKNTTMKIVQELITDATQEYFRHNTIPGCMNPEMPNYFYKANVDDNSCQMEFRWPTFGGIFQKCQFLGSYLAGNGDKNNFTSIDYCKQYELKNPYTKDYTCTFGFDATEIDSFYVTVKNRTHSVQFSTCSNSSSVIFVHW
uniref:Macrophage-expressed gene 1 protein n=1 Tax=Panagrolaimus superbus TaxID=310955 RepID=A0A914ZA42_9BILA